MTDKLYGAINPAAATAASLARLRKPAAPGGGAEFAQVLQDTLAGSSVKFSAHAQQRLAASDIRLGGQDLARIERAVERADQKGAKDSLILLEDLALVVSIKNRTVITAVDGARAKENVFTNVDSVVIG